MNEKEQDIEQTAAESVVAPTDVAHSDIVASDAVQAEGQSDVSQSDVTQSAVAESVADAPAVEEDVVQVEMSPAIASETQELRFLLEATLLAAGRPVTTQQMLDLFDERDRPTAEQLEAALDLLKQDYAARGIELVQVASGWRVQVRSRYVESVSRLWAERPSKYSRALLETLALVAYRQPITRSEIEEIRGVSISSTIMRTLQERNWIRVVGHREVPGRPELLGTTREFLDYFGLRSLDQLPTLAELKDVETIGVQLELPGGKSAGDETEGGAVEGAAATDAPVAEAEEESTLDSAADDPELSADAESDADDEIDDDAEDTPTLVASADDERDESRYISDPPVDDR
jgi:segregation and condensation protein B